MSPVKSITMLCSEHKKLCDERDAAVKRAETAEAALHLECKLRDRAEVAQQKAEDAYNTDVNHYRDMWKQCGLNLETSVRLYDEARAAQQKAECDAAALRECLLTVERTGAPGGAILAKRSDDHACSWCRGMYTPCPTATARKALDGTAGRAMQEVIEAARKLSLMKGSFKELGEALAKLDGK